MALPELYLSKPGVTFPGSLVDNAEIVRRVRERYRGSASDWPNVEAAIEHMFGLCRTRTRYLAPAEEARVADFAVAAAQQCIAANRAALDEVDLVIFGGIAREYFEPATAMEIAAKLGLKRTHAFDVTTACVGHLEAVQTAAAYMALHPHYRAALVCTSELSGDFLDYDIQSVRELATKFAGLTIGNAAACVLLRREPWPGGGIRLLSMRSHAVPNHWNLCRVPIRGTLISSSFELMRLRKLIPPVLRAYLADTGWAPGDVEHWIVHQPSELVLRQILEAVEADPARAVYTHHLYGNTASSSIGVSYQHLLQERDVKPGDKIILGSAAAGFSVVLGAGVWSTGLAGK